MRSKIGRRCKCIYKREEFKLLSSWALVRSLKLIAPAQTQNCVLHTYKKKKKETCSCKTNIEELCIPARTVGDVELLGGCYTVNEGTEGLLSWWQKKKKDNVVAFYSHTIDRCLITKEEKKKSYSVIERSAVQVVFFLFWNKSNNSYLVRQIFPIQVIAKKAIIPVRFCTLHLPSLGSSFRKQKMRHATQEKVFLYYWKGKLSFLTWKTFD